MDQNGLWVILAPTSDMHHYVVKETDGLALGNYDFNNISKETLDSQYAQGFMTQLWLGSNQQLSLHKLTFCMSSGRNLHTAHRTVGSRAVTRPPMANRCQLERSSGRRALIGDLEAILNARIRRDLGVLATSDTISKLGIFAKAQ